MNNNKIIKVNYSISQETKDMLDKYRKENKINMSHAMDKVLKFNKEGLKQYIELLCKFNKQDEWQVKDDNFVCTTIPDQIETISIATNANFEKSDLRNASISSVIKNEQLISSGTELNEVEKIKEQVEFLTKQVDALTTLYSYLRKRTDNFDKKHD